jgi:hypothetical protein
MSKDKEWAEDVEKRYSSIENYVEVMSREGAEPLLFGYYPFKYLYEKSLLQEHDVLRTNLQGGSVDGHYKIAGDGKLEGIEAADGLYSGQEGIYEPKDILNLKNSENGWTLGIFAKSRISLASKL